VAEHPLAPPPPDDPPFERPWLPDSVLDEVALALIEAAELAEQRRSA
jgi:hypothetical protein